MSVRPTAIRLPLLLAVIALAGCQHAAERIAQEESAVQARWQELATQPVRDTVTVDWEDAARRLERGNFKLRKARDGVQSALEGLRQVPRRYIPELTLSTFTNPTFENLGQGDLGNSYLFLGTLIDLPNPGQYRAAALQAELRYVGARVDAETLRRELHAKLYTAFRDGARLARDERELAALQRLDAAASRHPYAAETASLAAANETARQKLDAELSDLFGDFSHHWRIAAAPRLPDIDYAAHPPALDGHDGFASLQVTRAALQLVVIEAQREGLLAAEWPQVSVLLSAPPIYQRSTGRESYLSFNDLRLSAFVAYSTDFRGTRALARKQAARRAEITKAELDVTMQATLVRLRDALQLGRELEARLRGLRDARDRLHATPGAAGIAWDDTIADLQRQLDELNLSFWVLDERRWNPQP